MKNWGMLAVGGVLAALGIWWFTKREWRPPPEPRWQEGERLPAGITVVRVELDEETSRYVYWLEYDEVPGQWYGPLTEEEVLAQWPSALPSALIEAGTR